MYNGMTELTLIQIQGFPQCLDTEHTKTRFHAHSFYTVAEFAEMARIFINNDNFANLFIDIDQHRLFLNL
jgi:hypothetical protein